MPFTVRCFPFYSAILGFPRYYWFLSFSPLGTRTNVVPTTFVVGPFLIPHYFLLLRFLLQKASCWLSRLGGPRRLAFVLSFSNAFIFHFFHTHLLVAFPFVIFPKCAGSFLLGRKIPSHLPSWFFFLSSPRYQALAHELLVPKPFDPFSASLGGW